MHILRPTRPTAGKAMLTWQMQRRVCFLVSTEGTARGTWPEHRERTAAAPIFKRAAPENEKKDIV